MDSRNTTINSKKIAKTDILFYLLIILFVVSAVFYKDIVNIWENRAVYIESIKNKYSEYVEESKSKKEELASSLKAKPKPKRYGTYSSGASESSAPSFIPARERIVIEEPKPVVKEEVYDYSSKTPSEATEILKGMMNKDDFKNIKKLKAVLEAKADVNAKTYGDTIFVDAIAKGAPVEFVEMLIEYGGDLDYKTYDRKDLLTKAATWTTNPKLIPLLAQKGAKCGAMPNHNENHLMVAARYNPNPDVAEEFTKICGLDATDDFGENALFFALEGNRDGSYAPFVRLVELGVPVNVKSNNYNQSLLNKAAEKGAPFEVFEALLKAGANVNDDSGYKEGNALHYVRGIKDPAIIKLLAAAKIDMNHKDKDGYTPLAMAVRDNKDEEILRTMIDLGGKVDFKTEYENLATLAAKNIKDEKTIRFLVSKGIDLNFQNTYKQTPLMLALTNYNQYVMKAFLEGSDVNLDLKDSRGDTALAYAIDKDSELKEVIIPLVEKGADVNAVNNDGYSILEKAINRGVRLDTIKYLLEKGAKANKNNATLYALERRKNAPVVIEFIKHEKDIEAKDKSGYTALARAISDKYNIDVIKALIDKGANVNYKLPTGISILDLAKSKYSENDEIISMLITSGAK